MALSRRWFSDILLKEIAMELKTERLILKLLTLSQLKLWVSSIPKLELELDCKYDGGPVERIFLDFINYQIKKIKNDPSNLLYISFWFIIRKDDKKAVGSISFKNIPNELKEVEIGYGLQSEFEHNGYMTEAVRAFCNMALNDKKIETVIAETEKENTASYKVLERCGFIKYKEEESLWWKLDRKNNGL
jgi:RimJ/RimL family protein N-acetyltransferase